MRIKYKLPGRAFLEIFVCLRSLFERNQRDVQMPAGIDPVVEDGFHQLAVISHDRTLPSPYRLTFDPGKSPAQRLDSLLSHLIGSARIFGKVKSRNPNATRHPGNFHEWVEQWRFNIGLFAKSVCFIAHAIDG